MIEIRLLPKWLMKHSLSLFLLFAAIFISVSLSAGEGYTVKTVPANEIAGHSYVTDLSAVLTAGQKAEINACCRFAKDSLGAEIAVVTLPGIDADSYGSLHEFGTELYNTWKIGDSQTERGLLIVFATSPGEREISFVTGYGMEEVLPDVICKRIQADVMVPLMKEGRYAEGLLEGVKTACSVISGDVVMPDEESDDPAAAYIAAFVLSAVLILILIGVAAVRAERKRLEKIGRSLTCSSCGVKGKMSYSHYVDVKRPTRRSAGIGRHYYVCQECGAENFKDVVLPRESGGSGISGPLAGGGAFGRGSGGGFSGGSFGGGFSGGGGASTRF